MPKLAGLLVVAISVAVTHCRVTFTNSEVLQETDLDKDGKAKFKCDNGCYVYSTSRDADMWINDGTQDVGNFYMMGKPDKGTTTQFLKWNDYRLEWRGVEGRAPPKFVFYVVDMKAANLDTRVHAYEFEVNFGFDSKAARMFTLLSTADFAPVLTFDGDFADGYPRVYATGFDAASEDACKPVYQARSSKSAANSLLLVTSAILTVDKGPAKGIASINVRYSNAYDQKPAESSLVYKSPGYVGCSYINNQIYSSSNDKVQNSFSADVKSLDLDASLNIPTADEAVHITVNNEKVDLYGTTPVKKHFDADKFDVTISWNRAATTTSSFAVQFDLGVPNKGQEVKSTTKYPKSTTTVAPLTSTAQVTTELTSTVQTTTKSGRGKLLLSAILSVVIALI